MAVFGRTEVGPTLQNLWLLDTGALILRATLTRCRGFLCCIGTDMAMVRSVLSTRPFPDIPDAIE